MEAVKGGPGGLPDRFGPGLFIGTPKLPLTRSQPDGDLLASGDVLLGRHSIHHFPFPWPCPQRQSW